MTQNLWGEEIQEPTPQPKQQPTVRNTSPIALTATDCFIFGHSWQVIGMSGEKQCTVCKVKGFCPGCTPTPPKDAHPFFCTKHTPSTESQVSA